VSIVAQGRRTGATLPPTDAHRDSARRVAHAAAISSQASGAAFRGRSASAAKNLRQADVHSRISEGHPERPRLPLGPRRHRCTAASGARASGCRAANPSTGRGWPHHTCRFRCSVRIGLHRRAGRREWALPIAPLACYTWAPLVKPSSGPTRQCALLLTCPKPLNSGAGLQHTAMRPAAVREKVNVQACIVAKPES
jgi:hypothetical protein